MAVVTRDLVVVAQSYPSTRKPLAWTALLASWPKTQFHCSRASMPRKTLMVCGVLASRHAFYISLFETNLLCGYSAPIEKRKMKPGADDQ